jgi:hypothetical protein
VFSFGILVDERPFYAQSAFLNATILLRMVLDAPGI